MTKCEYCGKEVLYPFKCSFCEGYFCVKHRLPENHDCPNAPARTPLGPWYAKKTQKPKAEEIKALIPKQTKPEKRVASEGQFYFVKAESPKPQRGWKQKLRLKINIFGIIAGVLAFVSLILPWWYFQVSTSILGVSLDTSITTDLYKATFSARLWGEGGQIPYVADFPINMWFGFLASRFIFIAGILAVVGGLISDRLGKAISVLAGIFILFSIITYAYGLQSKLPELTDNLHNYPYNLEGFPEVQLFSSGTYSHPAYPVPAWNYSSYFYIGFWVNLIASILAFISASKH